jgi:hypothetical protein
MKYDDKDINTNWKELLSAQDARQPASLIVLAKEQIMHTIFPVMTPPPHMNPVVGGYFSPTSNHILCYHHLRTPPTLEFSYNCQPAFAEDVKSGEFKACPFCKGGLLHGQFHRYRSVRRWERVLQELEEK